MAVTDPTLAIQWDLGGVWLDLPQPRSCEFSRGKEQTLNEAQPRTLVATFSNANRGLDPRHTALYTFLHPGTRIRARATWASVTYELFIGTVNRIVQRGNGPHDAIFILECVDLLSGLVAAKLSSPWEMVIAGIGAPRTYLRLNEQEGPTAFDRSGNAHHGTYTGTPVFGVAGLLGNSSDAAVRFEDVPDKLTLPGGSMPTVPPWSVTFLINMPLPPSTTYLFYAAAFPQGLAVWMDTAGKINAEIYNGATQTFSKTTSSYAGNTHLVTIAAAAGFALRIQVDGGDATAYGSSIGTGGTLNAFHSYEFAQSANDFTIDEFIVHDFALSATDYAYMSFALTAWAQDNSNDRILRVLDAAGWPLTDVDITTDNEFLSSTRLGVTALKHIQEIANTVDYRFWVTPSGIFKVISPADAAASPYTVSQATFTDDGSGMGYASLGELTLDWDLLTNVVRRIHDETIIEASDVASINTYGRRDNTPVSEVTSLLFDLAPEYAFAASRLARFKDPKERIDKLTLTPRGDATAMWPTVLALDLADRITIEHTPQGIGSPIILDTIIEGITYKISPKSWIVELSIDDTYA